MKKFLTFLIFALIFSCSGKDKLPESLDIDYEVKFRDEIFQKYIQNRNNFDELPLITEEDENGYLFASAYTNNDTLKFFHEQYSDNKLLYENYFFVDKNENLIFYKSIAFNPSNKKAISTRKIYFLGENSYVLKDTLHGENQDFDDPTEILNHFGELFDLWNDKKSNN